MPRCLLNCGIDLLVNNKKMVKYHLFLHQSFVQLLIYVIVSVQVSRDAFFSRG